MAASTSTLFKKTIIHSRPKSLGEEVTSDSLYWREFEFPITKKEYGPITDVQFNPVEPYNYAVTNSTRIQVYSSETHQPLKTYSKFKEQVHCGRFRHDGQLLIAGTAAGIVKVYDLQRKSCLRSLRGHSSGVHAAGFLPDGLRLLSCADDQRAVLWDLASGEQISQFTEHTDNVRCCAFNTSAKDILLTGCYDHKARLYDVRSASCVQSVDHGAPIEDVLMFPSGTLYLTAGSTYVRVWDSLAGGKLLLELNNHHKTVMRMTFTKDFQRLLTAGLDRHVKVYDVSSYQVVHTMDLPAPILSIGCSADERVFAAGMSDGLLSVRKRKVDGGLTKQERRCREFQTRVDNKSFKPSKEAHVVQLTRRQHLAKYDQMLRHFEHSKALDAVLEPQIRYKLPEVTVSLIEELIRRDAIKAALAGRDEKSLDILLRFISKHVTNPQYTKTLIDVINLILDVYSDHTERLTSVIPRLQALKSVVDNELRYEEQLLQLLGTMDSILAMANSAEATNNTTQIVKNISLSL